MSTFSDRLLANRQMLEQSRDAARATIKKALEEEHAAKAVQEEAMQSVKAARALREEAAQLLASCEAALRAMTGRHKAAGEHHRHDTENLLLVAEHAIKHAPNGLDDASLRSAIEATFTASKRGAHKTVERVLKAMEKDPRFERSGNTWRVQRLESSGDCDSPMAASETQR